MNKEKQGDQSRMISIEEVKKVRSSKGKTHQHDSRLGNLQ